MSLNRRIRFLKLCSIVATVAAATAFSYYTVSRPSRSQPRRAATRNVPELQALNNPEHESAMLGAALKKNPGHVPILLRLASLEEAAGHHDEAIARLQEALKQEPGNFEAKLDLGKALFERGDIQAAVDQNNAILKVKPDQPDALYNLGAIYGNLGDNKLAEYYWNRLLTTAPASESGRRAREMMALLTGGSNSKPLRTASGARWQ